MSIWLGSVIILASALIGLVLIGVAGMRRNARAVDLSVGMDAPYFELLDAQGELRRVTDFRGEWLLLYFYPKDDTPGCTREACAFRDGHQELLSRGVRVIGVSVDDVPSHRAFAAKYGLPFTLLSDPDGAVSALFGVLRSWGPIRFAKRNSFLIDRTGKIAKIYRAVDVQSHYREVLGDLSRLNEPMRARAPE